MSVSCGTSDLSLAILLGSPLSPEVQRLSLLWTMKHKPGLTVASLYRPLVPTPLFLFNKVRTQLSGLMAPSLDVPAVSVSL